MAKQSSARTEAPLPRWYRGADVPKSAILQFARAVAARFKPVKIVLFGSHAQGKPHADSDVDILVIMQARNEIDQAVRIDRAIDPSFPLDLIVCTPKNLAWRLRERDSFMHEVMTKGIVLYEKTHRAVGTQGRVRQRRGRDSRAPKRPAS